MSKVVGYSILLFVILVMGIIIGVATDSWIVPSIIIGISIILTILIFIGANLISSDVSDVQGVQESVK